LGHRRAEPIAQVVARRAQMVTLRLQRARLGKVELDGEDRDDAGGQVRSPQMMTLVDPGVLGECDARTQGGSIAELSARPRTRQRAAERGRATQSLIV